MHDFRYQQCSLVTIESSIEHFLRIGSIKFFNQTLLAKTLWCTRLARVPCCLQARHHETRWTHIQRGKANQTRVIDSGNVLELGSHKIMVDVKKWVLLTRFWLVYFLSHELFQKSSHSILIESRGTHWLWFDPGSRPAIVSMDKAKMLVVPAMGSRK